MINLPIKADEICAIIPEYKNESGDGVRIIDKNGRGYFICKKVRSVLKYMAWFFAVDLKAIREKCRSHVDVKLLIPIPFSKDIILVPLKMRQALVKGDDVTGYVNYFSIDLARSTGQRLVLHNNVVINVYNSKDTIYKHIMCAENIRLKLYKGNDIVKENKIIGYIVEVKNSLSIDEKHLS